MRRRSVLIGGAVGLLLALAVHSVLVISSSPMLPLRIDPLSPDAASAPVDEHLEVARRHAPWILHETSAELGRQDVPTAMDFDGDRDGMDNWDELPHFELIPTLYYTYAQTQTHVFLTYHLFHPRDWARVPLGIQDTHEGDGENLQVVVDKTNDSIVLLTTQAHYDAASYAPTPGPIQSGAETLRGDFELTIGHPNVYVESGGHGIYSTHDPRAANRLAHVGDAVVIYRAAREGEVLFEPGPPWNESVPYRLVSLPAFLANETAHPTLFAGYEGAVPRYHKGDRYSGPLGASRGISPFALGHDWSDEAFSSLFFEPAETYLRDLRIEGAWSTEYIVRPFADAT